MIKPLFLKNLFLILSGGILALISCSMSSPLNRPFPQHLNYGNHSILPNRYSRATLTEDIRAYYNRWKANYMVSAGNNESGQTLYRIAMGSTGQPNHGITVSEGQGYGMIIVAIMAGHDHEAQNLFDGLWRFTRMHSGEHTKELMAWRVAPNDPQPGDGNSAFDGDADIAYALILAHHQWEKRGTIDYQTEALTLIKAIKRTTIGPHSKLPMLGDWVDPLGERYNQYTLRTSDFMLANFRAFYRLSGDRDWLDIIGKLIRVSQFLQKHYSPNTGLLPDFVEPNAIQHFDPQPATQHFLESEHDGDYYYNAWRVPWRLGMDALLNQNPESIRLVQKMSNWLNKHYQDDIRQVNAGFKLNGTPLSKNHYFSTALIAPFGVAAMTDVSQQTWLNHIYAAIRHEHSGYYEDSINLLSLLLMTGNFWDS